MSNNINCLIVGTGEIAKEYCKVLKALNVTFSVVGRNSDKANKFGIEQNVPCFGGGVENFLNDNKQICFTHAIVATDVLSLPLVTKVLILNGIKNIFVEKPLALNVDDVRELYLLSNKHNSNIYIAYNRRFYSSTQKVLDYIVQDGGVKSFNFEFTEWSHVIEKLDTKDEIKQGWFLANSSHVVDLAFYLGGKPKQLSCYKKGSLPWHSKGCIYAGAGVTNKDALFSYQANWSSPGRWSVEILTSQHRLYLKPMEKLFVQKLGSVSVEPVEIDDSLDIEFKPGFYKETESFIKSIDDEKKKSIKEQLEDMEIFSKIDF